jgi:hypothetical protein
VSRPHSRPSRRPPELPAAAGCLGSQKGQSLVVVAMMLVVLLGAVALTLDLGVGYYYNAKAERAAAAGALAGVVFMPSQFGPCCAGADAVDRAVGEVHRNGFASGTPVAVGGSYVATDAPTHVTVTVTRTSSAQQLQVTVTQDLPARLLPVYGLSTLRVSRTATAGYLAPIPLGQPGSQLGSTVSQLGAPSTNNFHFVRLEGWSTPRSEGDAYSPNPGSSTDVHNISAASGNEVSDATLPSRGGYNYQVFLPQGGQIYVYNAAFGPDMNPAVPRPAHNFCENLGPPQPSQCNTNGPNYYLHEDDPNFSWTGGVAGFAAMRYTVFSVANLFLHSTDVKLSQVTVLPIDASNWNQTSNQYQDVVHNGTISQQYDGAGNPSNMAIYHSWVPITTYSGAGDKTAGKPSLVQWNTTPLTGDLPPGTYRLRVDMLNYDGTLPPGGATAHKAIGVRVKGPAGSVCDSGPNPCSVGAWDDLAIYTPVSGTNFSLPLFQLPPSYAGQTVDVDIYDPGDINANGGSASMDILDASTGSPAAGSGIVIYDLGTSRADPPANPPTCAMGSPVGNPPCVVPSSGTATFPLVNSGGQAYYNGHWVRVEIPISSTYRPTGAPSTWYWQMRYNTTVNVRAVDTITVTVSLRGAPAHLLSS